MIVKAKYTGPYPEVTVPGFRGKKTVPGEEVTMRIPDGMPLGGCWEITEGLKEYQAAIKAREDAIKAAHEASQKKAAERVKKIKDALPDETAAYLANGEKDYTKPAKPAKPAGGAK